MNKLSMKIFTCKKNTDKICVDLTDTLCFETEIQIKYAEFYIFLL